MTDALFRAMEPLTEIRALKPQDFLPLWELTLPYMDRAMTPDMDRAVQTYNQMIGDRSSLFLGQFEEGVLTGAIIVEAYKNAYARKSSSNVVVWLGSMALLEQAIQWWEGRPALRLMMMQFPIEPRRGMYRYLRAKGFEREGDMNVLRR